MEENILVWNIETNSVEINTNIAFIFKTQHGIPYELFEEMVNEKLPVGSSARINESLKAYNKAHNTNYEYITN